MWLYFLIFRAQLVYGYVSDWAQNQSEHIRAWYIAWNIIFMCAWRAKTVKREDEAIGATSAIRQQSLFSTIVASSTQFHRLYCFYLYRVPQIQPQLYIMLQFTHNFLWCLIFSAHAQILGVYIKGFKWKIITGTQPFVHWSQPFSYLIVLRRLLF